MTERAEDNVMAIVSRLERKVLFADDALLTPDGEVNLLEALGIVFSRLDLTLGVRVRDEADAAYVPVLDKEKVVPVVEAACNRSLQRQIGDAARRRRDS